MLLACPSNAARSPVSEPATRTHTRPATSDHTTTAPWLARIASLSGAGDARFRSQHFDATHFAEVRVNSEAKPLYDALVTDTRFSKGTLIVEALSRTDHTAPDAFLALELSADGWRFVQLDAGGVPTTFDDAPCRGCHAGATSPPVFGPAHSVPTRESKR